MIVAKNSLHNHQHKWLLSLFWPGNKAGVWIPDGIQAKSGTVHSPESVIESTHSITMSGSVLNSFSKGKI